MSEISKIKNHECEGRKFWAVVCVCVAGLLCATLLAIGMNSAKADVADVTFDDVTINAGAKISLNGTHTVTALYGNKLLADETNGEEVESAETDAIAASFATDHYESDALAKNLTNASPLDVDSFNTNRAFLSTVDKGFWLTDESSTYGVTTQAWRTASNGTETLTKDAQGKAPDGTLFTPAPEWGGEDYLTYSVSGYPKKNIEVVGYDVKKATDFEDCSWTSMTRVWDINNSEKVQPFELDTTLTKTIYEGKEIYNNPWCIEDHSRGFYKTTATKAYGIAGLIHGRVELFLGTDTAETASFLQYGMHLYPPISIGDTLLLTGLYADMFSDTTGFVVDSTDAYGRVRFNAYFKAEEEGSVTRQHWYLNQGMAVGWNKGTEKTEAVKGWALEAGKHTVRPFWSYSKIAFFRDAESGQELATSSYVGGTPSKKVSSGDSVKCSVWSNDVKINFDVDLENCSTDRDEGRNKCTKVEGTTIKVPWKTKELTLKNVETENANYVSALVQTADNKKCGVLAKADGSDVTLDLTNILSNTLIGDKITVSLYAEKANEAGFSDEISAKPVTFQVEVAALAPQRIVYDANGGTGTVPADTVGKAGEQVQIADGSGLYGATGNPFSHWELSWEPFEQTGEVVRKYNSGDQIVMPDAITYPEYGIITAKAIYAGGIEVEKSSETTGEYNRVVWDSNQGEDFEARIGSAEGEKTKTTLVKIKDGKATLSSANVPTVVNITDDSIYSIVGWSRNKSAKAGDSDVYSESQLDGMEISEKKVTYYAVWTDMLGFWLGTKDADSTKTDESDFFSDAKYVAGKQIMNDITVLREGDSNSNYSSVLTKWQSYYGDDVRLYATWKGGDATTEMDKLVEFRILQVGEHDDDGSVVTFGATHVLPTAKTMNSSATNSGSWANSAMRKDVMSDYVQAGLPSGLVSAAKSVDKVTTSGSSGSWTHGSTTSDKFWLLSISEVFGTGADGNSLISGGVVQYSKEEGTRYAWYTANEVNAKDGWLTPNTALQKNNKTRAGGYPAGLTREFWWLRSPRIYKSTTHFGFVEGDGSPFYLEANNSYGVVPCFCF